MSKKISSSAVTVGIMSKEAYVKRTIAIAKGEYKPQKEEPTIWFDSLRSMAEALNDDNRALLRLIIEKKPQSITELGDLSGRKKSNLSKTIRMLENYGIVRTQINKNKKVPTVNATSFRVEFGI